MNKKKEAEKQQGTQKVTFCHSRSELIIHLNQALEGCTFRPKISKMKTKPKKKDSDEEEEEETEEKEGVDKNKKKDRVGNFHNI